MREQLRLDVYVLTSADLVVGRDHLDVARAAIAGGATMLQLRAPEVSQERLLPMARSFVALCKQAGVPGIVNDRIDVAIACDAAGVHLGQDDRPEGAREALGPDRILGASIDNPAQAREAEVLGADYLGVVVWSTGTKPAARPVGLHGLQAIARTTALPIVAIGGIDTSTAGEVLDAGASGVAVVSAVGASFDPVAATRSLVRVVAARRGRIAAPQEHRG